MILPACSDAHPFDAWCGDVVPVGTTLSCAVLLFALCAHSSRLLLKRSGAFATLFNSALYIVATLVVILGLTSIGCGLLPIAAVALITEKSIQRRWPKQKRFWEHQPRWNARSRRAAVRANVKEYARFLRSMRRRNALIHICGHVFPKLSKFVSDFKTLLWRQILTGESFAKMLLFFLWVAMLIYQTILLLFLFTLLRIYLWIHLFQICSALLPVALDIIFNGSAANVEHDAHDCSFSSSIRGGGGRCVLSEFLGEVRNKAEHRTFFSLPPLVFLHYLFMSFSAPAFYSLFFFFSYNIRPKTTL